LGDLHVVVEKGTMNRNPESPWNPSVPADITPAKFEEIVLAWLCKCSAGDNQRIETEHLGVVQGGGGKYKIDVLVKLPVFREAVVVILVECKHQARPVERDEALALEAKLRDVAAHKGMLFSTSGFQKGAIEYATARGIATVTVVRGEWLYETRGAPRGPVKPPPWVQFDSYAGIRVASTGKGISSHTIAPEQIEALMEWIAPGRTAE
jgi:restriction system protein